MGCLIPSGPNTSHARLIPFGVIALYAGVKGIRNELPPKTL